MPDPTSKFTAQAHDAIERHLRASIAIAGAWSETTIPTMENLAHRFALPEELIRRVHFDRSVEYADMPLMPLAKLAHAVWRLGHPNRPDRPDENARWRWKAWRNEGGGYDPNGLVRASDQARAMRSPFGGMRPFAGIAGIDSTTWTWIGPGNVGGRTRAIVIHPTDPNQIWLGGITGGIWKSNDGGASWAPQNDFMPNLVVSCLLIDSATPTTLYAGTGEGFGNSDGYQGAGIFKTVDGGITWTQLASTNPVPNPDWYYVNRLAMAQGSPKVLFAATAGGVYRSTNEGAAWTQPTTTRALDVDVHPGDSRYVLVGTSLGTVQTSTDNGKNFANASGPRGTGRVEVAWAPSDSRVFYASFDSSPLSIFCISRDAGVTYDSIPFLDGLLGVQGWYDNVVWVDPTDSLTVIVGGIDLWRIQNGGETGVKISQWDQEGVSPHADQHVIVAHPQFDGVTNRTVYFGNDGGIYRADNVYTVAKTSGWTRLNNGLGITQFNSGVATTQGVIWGGTQDNGTVRYTGATNNWDSHVSRYGDGGFVAAHPYDANYIFGEYINLQIYRSSDNGATATNIFNMVPGQNITDTRSGLSNFYSPFVLDQVGFGDVMYAGGLRLWRTGGSRNTPVAWSISRNPLPGDSPITAIALTRDSNALVGANVSNVIFIGEEHGRLYKTHQADIEDPTATWQRLDDGPGFLPNRMITRILVDPNKAQRVYLCFGGFAADNLFRSEDGGYSWTDVNATANPKIPSAPIRTIAISERNSDAIYVGTEIGVFASEDRGASWSAVNDGPANVSADDLFWYTRDTLVVATHGRGMYQSAIPKPGAGPNVWYVSPDGGDDGSGMSSGAPKRTIATVLDLLSDGDTIMLGPGTYTETALVGFERSLFNITRQNIAIIGSGDSTILDGRSIEGTDFAIHADSVGSLTVKNLTIRGVRQGISVTQTNDVTIRDCRFETTSAEGINIDNGSRIVISGNTFLGAGIGSGIILQSGTSNFLITGNTISGVPTQSGINLSNVETGVISGNAVSGCGSGIVINSGLGVTVSANDCRNNDNNGIGFGGGSANTIDSNLTSGCWTGIFLYGSVMNVITNNISDVNSNAGIQLDEGTNSNTIVGNRFTGTNSQYGIHIAGASNQNVFRRNHIGFKGVGVYLDTALNNTVSGNEIVNCGTGIELGYGASGNIFARNNVRIPFMTRGILDSSVVHDNTFRRNYWGSVDSSALSAKLLTTFALYSPWRLGEIDTAAGADTIAPEPPAGLGADTTGGTIRVTWSASLANEDTLPGAPAVAAYRVYRATSAFPATWIYKGQTAALEFTDSTPQLVTKYWYRVTAVDAAGKPNESFYSDSIFARLPSITGDFSGDSHITKDDVANFLNFWNTYHTLSNPAPYDALYDIGKNGVDGVIDEEDFCEMGRRFGL